VCLSVCPGGFDPWPDLSVVFEGGGLRCTMRRSSWPDASAPVGSFQH